MPARFQRAVCLAMPALIALLLGADDKAQPIWQRLAPEQRAKLLAALAAFVILGIGMMFLAWLGARATRRYMQREPLRQERAQAVTPLREKDWAEKPLTEPLDDT